MSKLIPLAIGLLIGHVIARIIIRLRKNKY